MPYDPPPSSRRVNVDTGPLVRHTVHVSSPVLLVYYFLPDDLGIALPKVYVVTMAWVAVLVIEVLRLATGVEILGLRDYERWQPSAYFWGGTALFIGILLFPPPFVAVGLIGMAWVDPLCGWTRQRGGYPYFPIVVYAALAFTTLWLTASRPLEDIATLTAVATALAILVEYPSLKWIDDDFSTQFVPALAMTLATMLL